MSDIYTVIKPEVKVIETCSKGLYLKCTVSNSELLIQSVTIDGEFIKNICRIGESGIYRHRWAMSSGIETDKTSRIKVIE